MSGSILLVFAMLPLWSVADTVPGQQPVEQPVQVSAGAEQAMPAWVEPPVGPYRFFPPQPVEYMTPPVQPDPAAGYPDNQNAPYPSAEYPGAGRQPLPPPDNGYAYDYQYRYQLPAAGRYGYNGAMQSPARTYEYGGYPRGYYPADMTPGYYPYGATEQMPVQPYYR